MHDDDVTEEKSRPSLLFLLVAACMLCVTLTIIVMIWRAESLAQAQNAPADRQQIQIVGSDSLILRDIAREMRQTLSGQSRVSNVSLDTTVSAVKGTERQLSLSVSYEFRGPMKLADRVRRSLVSSIVIPQGYSVAADSR